MKLKKKLLISIISVFVAVSAIMMLSYVQAQAIYQEAYPFGMGQNHIVMKSDSKKQVCFSDVINIDEDIDVLIISRDDENSETIGVYDPSMVMAFWNTASGLGITRYFSYDDYINKTKSGILITDNSTVDKIAYISENIDDLMYCVDTQSSFNYYGDTKEVVNLASLSTLGNNIYLDYGNEKVANNIVKRLTNLGYRKLSLEYVGLLESIFSFNHDIYEAIMIAGLVIYLLFGVVAFWHLYNNRKEIRIHLLHGGTLKSLAINLWQFVILNLIGMIPVTIFSLFQRKMGNMFTSNVSLMMFLGVHVLITSILYMLAFSLVYVMSQKRDDIYVR
ncbi:MAG TPA: hypothetical protein DC024_13310 [Clostridiales bacterium]|jgi:hypothetical protein|nr:hypothetical protein [Clostridiales bacterium]